MQNKHNYYMKQLGLKLTKFYLQDRQWTLPQLCEQLMNTPVPTTFFKRTFFAVYFYFDLLILLTHQDDQLTSFQKHEFFALYLQTFCRNPRFRPSTRWTSTLLPHSSTLSNDVPQVRSHEHWPLKPWELTETTDMADFSDLQFSL